MACASIDDYLNQVIKRHENTKPEKEADRIRHVTVCQAQTGPIFLAHRPQPELRQTSRILRNALTLCMIFVQKMEFLTEYG